MKSPFLSLVIPTYKSPDSLIRLLQSIDASASTIKEAIEIIIVDDGSDDDIVKRIQLSLAHIFENKKNVSRSCIIHLHQNSGPAKARNIGVNHAQGEIVCFFDDDVVLHADTLAEIILSFRTDLDLYALTGVWNKTQKSRSFFPRFKALRDWSYWINERDPKNYYYLFSTRVAAINRQLFLRLGGFDETYTAALVEDIDLTYRIARRYAVVFNPKVMVDHEFEPFAPVAKKYFLRSFYWSKLYRKRKKFDPVATTFKEAITTVSAGIFFVSSMWYLVSGMFSFFIFPTYVLLTTIYLSFFIHLWGVRKFLWFCYREEGFIFTIKSFFMGMILYVVILSGAVYSWMR